MVIALRVRGVEATALELEVSTFSAISRRFLLFDGRERWRVLRIFLTSLLRVIDIRQTNEKVVEFAGE